SRTRWLLIQAAVSILRRLPPQADWLRTGALHIAAHRGTQAAVVPPRPPPRREPLCPAAAMTVCLRHSSSPNEKEASQECVGLRHAITLSLTMGGAPEADGTATRTANWSRSAPLPRAAPPCRPPSARYSRWSRRHRKDCVAPLRSSMRLGTA